MSIGPFCFKNVEIQIRNWPMPKCSLDYLFIEFFFLIFCLIKVQLYLKCEIKKKKKEVNPILEKDNYQNHIDKSATSILGCL